MTERIIQASASNSIVSYNTLILLAIQKALQCKYTYMFNILSTILQHFTHNEIQFPNAARQWNFVLRDVYCRQRCHVSTPSHSRVPQVCPYFRQTQWGWWRLLKWSIADFLTSQSSSNVSLPFAWITGHAMHPNYEPPLILFIHFYQNSKIKV